MNLFLIAEFFYFVFSFKRRQSFCMLNHMQIFWFVPHLQIGEKITKEKKLIRDLSRDRQNWVILNLWHKTMVTCQGICYDECLAGFPGPQEAITSVTSQLNPLNTFLKIFFVNTAKFLYDHCNSVWTELYYETCSVRSNELNILKTKITRTKHQLEEKFDSINQRKQWILCLLSHLDDYCVMGGQQGGQVSVVIEEKELVRQISAIVPALNQTLCFSIFHKLEFIKTCNV